MKSLLLKYESDSCNPKERQQVESFLKDQLNAKPIEAYQKALAHEMVIPASFDPFKKLKTQPSYVDAMMDAYASGTLSNTQALWIESIMDQQSMDPMYDQLLQQEKSIQYLPTSSQENQDEIEFDAMPSEYKLWTEHEKKIVFDTSMAHLVHDKVDIEKALDAFANDHATTEQIALVEQMIADQATFLKSDEHYKQFIAEERNIQLQKAIHVTDKKTDTAKVIPLRRSWRKLAGIAAMFIMVMTAGLWGYQQTQKQVFAETIEIQDPDEALRITLAALGLAGQEIEKGTNQFSKIKHVSKTNIFR